MYRLRRLAPYILLVLLILLLGWTLWRNQTPTDAPADEFLDFACAECQYAYRLSHREFDRLMERRAFRIESGREFRLQCPQCERYTARRIEPQPVPSP